MDYTEKDFDNCFINPYKINNKLTCKNIESNLPALYVYPEFKKETTLPLAIILKYIAALYQEQTPLRKIDNITKRKIIAASIAGFPTTEQNEITEEGQDIINSKNEIVNKMIIRFCRIQRNPNFTRLVKTEEFYHNEFTLFEIEQDATKRATIMKNISTLGNDMQVLINELLIDDPNKNLSITLLEQIEAEQLELSPEYVAYRISSGEDMLKYSPYPSYKPDKLKCEHLHITKVKNEPKPGKEEI